MLNTKHKHVANTLIGITHLGCTLFARLFRVLHSVLAGGVGCCVWAISIYPRFADTRTPCRFFSSLALPSPLGRVGFWSEMFLGTIVHFLSTVYTGTKHSQSRATVRTEKNIKHSRGDLRQTERNTHARAFSLVQDNAAQSDATAASTTTVRQQQPMSCAPADDCADDGGAQ